MEEYFLAFLPKKSWSWKVHENGSNVQYRLKRQTSHMCHACYLFFPFQGLFLRGREKKDDILFALSNFASKFVWSIWHMVGVDLRHLDMWLACLTWSIIMHSYWTSYSCKRIKEVDGTSPRWIWFLTFTRSYFNWFVQILNVIVLTYLYVIVSTRKWIQISFWHCPFRYESTQSRKKSFVCSYSLWFISTLS